MIETRLISKKVNGASVYLDMLQYPSGLTIFQISEAKQTDPQAFSTKIRDAYPIFESAFGYFQSYEGSC